MKTDYDIKQWCFKAELKLAVTCELLGSTRLLQHQHKLLIFISQCKPQSTYHFRLLIGSVEFKFRVSIYIACLLSFINLPENLKMPFLCLVTTLHPVGCAVKNFISILMLLGQVNNWTRTHQREILVALADLERGWN